MSGPQSFRSPGVDRKLGQLDVPSRPSLAPSVAGSSSAGGGGVSSWDSTEIARQLAQITNERDFLKKYVLRCEAELKAYQVQYPELTKGANAAAGISAAALPGVNNIEELPPWISEARYMSPLLVAYESRIEDLQEKNQQQLHDFTQLKQQYDELLERTMRAEAELESNIKALLQDMDRQKGSVGQGKTGPLDEDEVQELHAMIDLLQEKLAIAESQKLQGDREIVELKQRVDSISQSRDVYWMNEFNTLKQQLGTTRAERDKYKNSSSTLVQQQQDLLALQKDYTHLERKYMKTQVELEETEKAKDDALEQAKSSSANLLNAEKDLESVMTTLAALEKQLGEYKLGEVNAIKTENVLRAQTESALLERDQSVQRENSVRSDLKRMEERLHFELHQAHTKHDDDLAQMYTRAKERENKLEKEVTQLSIYLAESEAEREKYSRDAHMTKQTCDTLIDKTTKEITSLKDSLNLMTQRNTELSYTTDVTLEKMKRTEAEMTRMTEFSQKEKLLLLEQLQTTKLKLDATVSQNQGLMIQVQTLTEGVERLQGEYDELKRLSDASITKLTTQLHELEHQRKTQVDELKQRLDEAYKMQERSEARSSELLAAQDVLAEKWKEENQSIRTQLTRLLTEEKHLTSTLHNKIHSLENRISSLIRERDQAMLIQSQYEQLKKQHEVHVQEHTQRIQTLSQELHTYIHRDAEYTLQQKTLQAKLDRAEVDVKRLMRQYEGQRRKAEFVEQQHLQGMKVLTIDAPLIVQQQALREEKTTTSSPPQRSGPPIGVTHSHLHPIPFAASLLPPTFNKKL